MVWLLVHDLGTLLSITGHRNLGETELLKRVAEQANGWSPDHQR
jgi:hypothetical protein